MKQYLNTSLLDVVVGLFTATTFLFFLFMVSKTYEQEQVKNTELFWAGCTSNTCALEIAPGHEKTATVIISTTKDPFISSIPWAYEQAKVAEVELSGSAAGWLEYQPQIVNIKDGNLKSKFFSVRIKAKQEAPAGSHALQVTVKSDKGEALTRTLYLNFVR